jgi:uncharacterized repeat protein (TIGR02543 family)
MSGRGVPWFLKASGAALLALGLVLLSAPAFAKELVPFERIDFVDCGYTQLDGSTEVVTARTQGFVYEGQVKDNGFVGFLINLKESVDEVRITESIDRVYQGIVASFPGGYRTYSCSFYIVGVGHTYTFNIVALWKEKAESCTFSFTVATSKRAYTLELYCTPGGTVAPPQGTYSYEEGTIVTIQAVPDSGYQFAGWSGDVSGTTNPLYLTMDRNYKITANFSPISPLLQYVLSVSVNPPGSGSVSLSPPGGTYASGTQVTLTATPASGYRFKSWSGSISSTSNPITIAMDGDKQVTVNFEYASAPSCTFYINGREVNPTISLFLDTSTWRFLLKADRELSGATVTISGAATATVQLSPEYGIPTQLGGIWSTTKEGRYTVTCTAYYPGGEITVASVEITYGQVTASPGYTALVLDVVGKGSVSVTEPCGKTEVPEHSIVRVQAFPAPGWRFKAWGGDVAGRGREPYLSFMASGSSMTIIAEFEREVGTEEAAWSFVRSHVPWMLVALGVVMLIGGEFLERKRG